MGPTGNPKSSIARSIASIATPSSSMRPASLMYGARIRLTKNPGASFTTITVFPRRRPNATVVAITSGAVRGVTITSSSGIFCTGEKKCMPMTRSGRRDPVRHLRDRDRARVAREDRRRREHVLDLREHLVLHREVLEHRLDHQRHVAEPGVVDRVAETSDSWSSNCWRVTCFLPEALLQHGAHGREPAADLLVASCP